MFRKCAVHRSVYQQKRTFCTPSAKILIFSVMSFWGLTAVLKALIRKKCHGFNSAGKRLSCCSQTSTIPLRENSANVWRSSADGLYNRQYFERAYDCLRFGDFSTYESLYGSHILKRNQKVCTKIEQLEETLKVTEMKAKRLEDWFPVYDHNAEVYLEQCKNSKPSLTRQRQSQVWERDRARKPIEPCGYHGNVRTVRDVWRVQNKP